MTEGEALALVTYIASAYPGVGISAETTAVYIEQLVELPFDVVRAAAVRHIRQSRFFPTVAELRIYAGAEWEPPSATEAWIEVTESLRSGRGFGAIDSNPIVYEAARAVWGDAYNASSTMDPDHRRFFLRLYEDLRERAILERRRGLAGGAERGALGPDGSEGAPDVAESRPSPARVEAMTSIATNIGQTRRDLSEGDLRVRLIGHLDGLFPEMPPELRNEAVDAAVQAWDEARAEQEGVIR